MRHREIVLREFRKLNLLSFLFSCICYWFSRIHIPWLLFFIIIMSGKNNLIGNLLTRWRILNNLYVKGTESGSFPIDNLIGYHGKWKVKASCMPRKPMGDPQEYINWPPTTAESTSGCQKTWGEKNDLQLDHLPHYLGSFYPISQRGASWRTHYALRAHHAWISTQKHHHYNLSLTQLIKNHNGYFLTVFDIPFTCWQSIPR